MKWHVYLSAAGMPAPDLFPDWVSLIETTFGADVTAEAELTEIGGGWYQIEALVPEGVVWVGVIDAGAGDPGDRFVPVRLSLDDEPLEVPLYEDPDGAMLTLRQSLRRLCEQVDALLTSGMELDPQVIRDALALALTLGIVPAVGSVDAYLLQLLGEGEPQVAGVTPTAQMNYPPKQPSEAGFYVMDFSSDLGVEAIVSAEVTAEVIDTFEDVTDTFTDVTKQTLAGRAVYFWLQGGDSLMAYKITVKVVGALGTLAERDAAILVLEQ